MALPRLFRLSKESDINKVFMASRAIESDFFRLFLRKNLLPQSRFAFILSKKVSKSSVRRNLLKRRASEAIRKYYLHRFKGRDIIIFFKKGASGLSRGNFYKELELIFSRVKI